MLPAEQKDGIKTELKERFGVDSHPQLKGRLTFLCFPRLRKRASNAGHAQARSLATLNVAKLARREPEAPAGAYPCGGMTMDKTTITPDVDTDQWDWVPAAPHPTRARALGAIALAASCLAVGILVGILWGSALQRSSVTTVRTETDTPKTSQSSTIQSSEPSLALGAPSDTPAKPREAAPKVPVVINERAAKTPTEQPRSRDGGSPEANARAVEGRPPKAQEVEPEVPVTLNENLANQQTGPVRQREEVVQEQKNSNARPAKGRSSESSFKDYRELRKYVLGK